MSGEKRSRPISLHGIKEAMEELMILAQKHEIKLTTVMQNPFGNHVLWSDAMMQVCSSPKSSAAQYFFHEAMKSRKPDYWEPSSWLEEQALGLGPRYKIMFVDFEAKPQFFYHDVEAEVLDEVKSIVDQCYICKAEKEKEKDGNQQGKSPQAAPGTGGAGGPRNQRRPVLPRHLEHRLARQASQGMRPR